MPVDTEQVAADLGDLSDRYSELQERLEQQAVDIREAKREAQNLKRELSDASGDTISSEQSET